ncbi:MAG TPA: patatin-like phospholipase family protein [Jatrophihabitans sp.]|uniref:patatin-like phospholipase family protein n=1 Tax=Jatrophihabitans sp. TaxID=1932789 RepID=UPI002F042308
MADKPKPVRRAFVFGGGGVLGFAWMAGTLTALQHEWGIEPAPDDLLVGTSAGAVVSGLLGCGLDIDRIRRHQIGMPLPQDPPIQWNYDSDTGGSRPPRPVWWPGSPRLVWDGIRRPASVSPVLALSGLLPKGRASLLPIHRMLDNVVAETLGPENWPQRTWIIAVDYSTGRRTVFGHDDEPAVGLADAVCASCAIPAWYTPMQINSRAYIDGGAASNASVDLLAGQDLDEVYVLAPMAAVEPDSPRSPVARIERRVRSSITRGINHDIAVLRQAGTQVTLLTPGPEDLTVMGANLMNPRRRTVVLHTAMRTSARHLRDQRRRHGTVQRAGTA